MINKVFVTLLNYNGTLDTIECIESLLKLDYENFQIIVVDNSETHLPYQDLINWAKRNFRTEKTSLSENDFSLHKKAIDFHEIIENQFFENEINAKIIFVKANQNKGFAAGNNIALNYILKFGQQNSFIWILNNDTIVHKEALGNQISYLEKPENKKIGILGSRLIYYYQQNKMQAVGGKFNEKFFISTHVGEGKSIDILKTDIKEIDYVIGAAMLVPYQFLKEVGTLCEDYFLYYEELDWAYQAKKKGWRLDWCSNSLVFHKEGASIGSSYNPKKKSFFSEVNIFKSRKIFVKKHYKLGLKFYISSLLLILNRVRKGKLKLGIELLKITFGK